MSRVDPSYGWSARCPAGSPPAVLLGAALLVDRAPLLGPATVHRCALHVVWRSADGGAGVGGDWFDVIELPSVRVASVTGDVFGHGLAAAATMGRLRTAIQTYADLELGPAETLAWTEHLVTRVAAGTGREQWDTVGATCLCAIYDPTTCTCVLATAGHPSPLLIGPDGTTRVLDLPHNPPLSAGGAPFASATVGMPPGSVLVSSPRGAATVPGVRDL